MGLLELNFAISLFFCSKLFYCKRAKDGKLSSPVGRLPASLHLALRSLISCIVD